MILLTTIVVALALFDTWYTYWLLKHGMREANHSMDTIIKLYAPFWNYVFTIFFVGVLLGITYFFMPEYYEWMTGFMVGFFGHTIYRNFLIYKRSKK